MTARAAVLAVVVCLLLLTLAYPLRHYLVQRAEISTLRTEHRQQQARITALADQVRQWQDPRHVEAQARQRLRYTRPGERTFVVLRAGETAGAGDGSTAGPAGGDAPWYSQLWDSVVTTGRPPAPTPETAANQGPADPVARLQASPAPASPAPGP